MAPLQPCRGSRSAAPGVMADTATPARNASTTRTATREPRAGCDGSGADTEGGSPQHRHARRQPVHEQQERDRGGDDGNVSRGAVRGLGLTGALRHVLGDAGLRAVGAAGGSQSGPDLFRLRAVAETLVANLSRGNGSSAGPVRPMATKSASGRGGSPSVPRRYGRRPPARCRPSAPGVRRWRILTEHEPCHAAARSSRRQPISIGGAVGSGCPRPVGFEDGHGGLAPRSPGQLEQTDTAF